MKSGGCFKDNTPDYLLFWTNLTTYGPESYENNYLSLHKKKCFITIPSKQWIATSYQVSDFFSPFQLLTEH